jgi:hypothetical protein
MSRSFREWRYQWVTVGLSAHLERKQPGGGSSGAAASSLFNMCPYQLGCSISLIRVAIMNPPQIARYPERMEVF